MIILSFAIPRIKGDAPIPLRQQLSLLRKPKVALGLSITFFWLGGYSIAYTYLSPYLLEVSGLSDKYLSGALLIFGIASMIGSKIGGFSTDRWGVHRTLSGGLALHIVMLILLSVVTHTLLGVMIVLCCGPSQHGHPVQRSNII